MTAEYVALAPRRVQLGAHHTLAAIGYFEERDAPTAITARPLLYAIWLRRSRNREAGMPATIRRNALPRLPCEGRLPFCSGLRCAPGRSRSTSASYALTRNRARTLASDGTATTNGARISRSRPPAAVIAERISKLYQ